MTTTSSPFLMKRDGSYFFRIRVPRDLTMTLDLTELRRSLGPCRFHHARAIAILYAGKTKEAFRLIRAEDLSSEQARSLIQSCFVELAAEAEHGFAPFSNEWQAIEEQRHFAGERITELQHDISSSQYRPEFLERVRQIVAGLGIDLTDTSAAKLHIIAQGVGRALIEQQRLLMFRHADAVMPYLPADPLFETQAGPAQVFANLETLPLGGPSVGEAIALYTSTKAPEWTPKTLASHSAKLKLLEEHLGPGTPVRAVTRANLWSFLDGLRRLSRAHHTGSSLSFADRQTDDPQQRISAATVSVHFDRARGFFRWVRGSGLRDDNPAEFVEVGTPKKQKGQKPRRPFTKAELETFFKSPLYQGSQSEARRASPGPHVIQDAHYWIPLLAYYGGQRLGELVQLHLEDVILSGTDVPHFAIREDGSGEIGTENHKHVKTEAGVREVPIHPDLLALGFGEFVAKRRKLAGKRKRLFWEVPYGADGQPSTTFSKWFARYLDKLGLTDPALVFHSFRHGIEDAFRNAKQPQYITDQIIGHSDGKVSSEYGKGVSLEVALEALKAAKLEVSVPDFWMLTSGPAGGHVEPTKAGG